MQYTELSLPLRHGRCGAPRHAVALMQGCKWARADLLGLPAKIAGSCGHLHASCQLKWRNLQSLLGYTRTCKVCNRRPSLQCLELRSSPSSPSAAAAGTVACHTVRTVRTCHLSTVAAHVRACRGTPSVPLSLSLENRAPLTIPLPERQTQWDGGSMWVQDLVFSGRDVPDAGHHLLQRSAEHRLGPRVPYGCCAGLVN